MELDPVTWYTSGQLYSEISGEIKEECNQPPEQNSHKKSQAFVSHICFHANGDYKPKIKH